MLLIELPNQNVKKATTIVRIAALAVTIPIANVNIEFSEIVTLVLK